MSNLQLFNQTITNPRTQEYLQQVLGEKKSAFVNNLTALVANNKNLQACEPLTLMYAAIKATALDLPLDSNLGFAYVIPYKNNKANLTEAQFQMGYKGLIQLAIRSGQFKTINVTDVREGEMQSEDMITGEIRFERSDNRSSLPIAGYVAFFSLINGFSKMLYMTTDDIEVHAKKYSQTYASKTEYVQKSSKWTTDFDAMAKKTVIKLLLSRYAPLSVQMQQAVVADQAVITTNSVDYVDNEEGETQSLAEEVEAESKAIADTAKQKSTESAAIVQSVMNGGLL